MDDTALIADALESRLPFPLVYVRRGGGTAIQRNVGIELATGAFVAFIDDDMLLEPRFLAEIVETLSAPEHADVAAVAGMISNQFLDPGSSPRWRWYRRLRLFGTYVPGKYDYSTGYPINRYLQPPHEGIREIDFMGTNCAVWRRRVFDDGVKFSPFFTDYGVMEDAHLALQARRRGWRILEVGRARCEHRHSPNGRVSSASVARKTAVNYRFLFVDTVPDRTLGQEFRFWRVQLVQLGVLFLAAARRGVRGDWSAVRGKLEGIVAATNVRTGDRTPP